MKSLCLSTMPKSTFERKKTDASEEKSIWTRARKSQLIQLSSSSSDSESEIEEKPKKYSLNDEKSKFLNSIMSRHEVSKQQKESSSGCKTKRPKEAKLAKGSPGKQVKSNNDELEALDCYENARRVLSSIETRELPGREQQLVELRKFLDQHNQKQMSGTLYISGPPGTGKTACLMHLLKEPAYADHLQCIYINCTSIASVGSVYKKICTELGLKLSPQQKPNERNYLSVIQAYLISGASMLLLVLDEIDQLCSQRHEVLYTIFEWPAIASARVMIIGIANTLDLTDRALVRLKTHCKLQPQVMHFPPYTKAQIVKIFQSRLSDVNVAHMFPESTLNLLAAKVSALSGDVRRALDIGRCVIGLAEEQSKLHNGANQLNTQDIEKCLSSQFMKASSTEVADQFKAVQVSQVATVLKNVYGASQTLQEDLEDAFPLQQKLMLCSLLLILRYEKHRDISLNHLHEVYRRVCHKRNIIALDQTEFFSLVDLVDTRGIIHVIRKKQLRLSHVSLQWDEEEVNAALCDKQLIAAILNDRSCLKRHE